MISMPIAMAECMTNLLGNIYPIFAPTIGAIGAFLAGSNTVSNLMLSQFQLKQQISWIFQVPDGILQSVGAAAGNMVALYVVAASATVGLMGKEGETICITILPLIYYLLLSGFIGLIF